MKLLFLLTFVLTSGSPFAQTLQRQSAGAHYDRRFLVDSVEIATIRLNEMNAQAAFENQLGKEVQFFPSELKDEHVVLGWGNCSRSIDSY
jgi:hypothetical protein